MKLQYIKPKYEVLEIIVYKPEWREIDCVVNRFEKLEKLSLENAKIKYQDYEILSIKNYDETKTTSVIVVNQIIN